MSDIMVALTGPLAVAAFAVSFGLTMAACIAVDRWWHRD